MAKKANSAYDGTPIQIKRTQLDTNHPNVAKDGTLKYGEPLLIQQASYDNLSGQSSNQDLLVFGSANGNVATQNLQAFSSDDQTLAPVKVFYKHTDGESINRVSLLNRDKLDIYTKFRTFTTKDSAGIPRDANDKAIIGKTWGATIGWLKVDSATGLPIDNQPAGEKDFPKALKIKVANMTSDTIPYIGLSLSNMELTDAGGGLAKKQKKSFGNISAVASYYTSSDDCGIIIYCCYKNLSSDVYIDVFGG